VKIFNCKLLSELIVTVLCGLCLLFLQIHRVHADTKDRNLKKNVPATERIQITADKLVSNSSEKYAEFIGNVRVNQGKTRITADSLKIYFSGESQSEGTSPAQSLEKLIATGNVEIKFDNRVAVTQKAVYITAQRLMILTGPGTTVRDGENTISGETITFYRDDGRFDVDGGASGRVKALILPDGSGLE
jgi:lipopolysaccharide export system protein LptA